MSESDSFHAGRAEVMAVALQRIVDWDYRGQTAEDIARTALILTEVREESTSHPMDHFVCVYRRSMCSLPDCPVSYKVSLDNSVDDVHT